MHQRVKLDGVLSTSELEVGDTSTNERGCAFLIRSIARGQAREPARDFLSRSFHPEQLACDLSQCIGSPVCAQQGDLGQSISQDGGCDRVTLGVVGVEECWFASLFDDARELPPEVERILHADV